MQNSEKAAFIKEIANYSRLTKTLLKGSSLMRTVKFATQDVVIATEQRVADAGFCRPHSPKEHLFTLV